MSPIDRPDFTGDGEVADLQRPAESVPRDEDGRRVMVDWSDGPKPPPPDPSLEVSSAMVTPEEGAEIVAEVNGDAPGSFDELDPSAQMLVRDQQGLDQVHASIETVRADLGADFAEAESDFEELPTGARDVVTALLSVDWRQHGAEAMADAFDQLSDVLPLTAEAELREFLVDHGFIEGE